MALYHCFNPDVPTYSHECNRCEREITSGTRWHCLKCFDFDMCDDCKNRYSHEHELTPIQVNRANYNEDSCVMDVGKDPIWHLVRSRKSAGYPGSGVSPLLHMWFYNVPGTVLLTHENRGAACNVLWESKMQVLLPFWKHYECACEELYRCELQDRPQSMYQEEYVWKQMTFTPVCILNQTFCLSVHYLPIDLLPCQSFYSSRIPTL